MGQLDWKNFSKVHYFLGLKLQTETSLVLILKRVYPL